MKQILVNSDKMLCKNLVGDNLEEKYKYKTKLGETNIICFLKKYSFVTVGIVLRVVVACKKWADG